VTIAKHDKHNRPLGEEIVQRSNVLTPKCSKAEGTMRSTKRIVVPLVTALAFCLVASFMDVIPADVAPVVRPDLQRYERTWVSMQMLYGMGRALSGVSCRSVDSTPWAALGVSAVALLAGGGAGYIVCRFIDCGGRNRRGPAETTASSTTSSNP
jgi:hypothetical protein